MPEMGKTEEDWNGFKLGFLKTVQPNSCLQPTACNFKNRLQNRWFFFSKSVKKSVKSGVRALRTRSARVSHALCFQPRSRPVVWLLAHTGIRKNTDCFTIYFKNNSQGHICLSQISDFTCNFFVYFKFHSDWGRVIGKIKQNELDCCVTAPLTVTVTS